MSPYQQLLTRPEWQKKRLQRLEMSNWKCDECGATHKQLHVHHIFYKSGRKPWEYDDLDLLVLCKDCHTLIEELSRELLRLASATGAATGKVSVGFRDGIKYLVSL